ncbi:hypothetical protein EPO33_01680 [Patescibacteria group bacterium]|nr:MAG: hypothetical protein EPO33_01680 [Patescibacteria group bacterium]
MSGNKLLALVVGLTLIGAGCGPSAPSRPTPSTTAEAAYVLTAMSDTTAYDRSPVATTFGCEDRLMLQRVIVSRSDRPALETNLNTMFAVRHADAERLGLYTPFGAQEVRATVTEEDGKTVVDISPQPISAGTCDDPRIKEMIVKTIALSTTDEVQIRVEGSEKTWRCMGDMSGLCR